MKRDWVVWGGCIGLFLAGGVYFNMLPDFVWKKEVGVADIVGVVSAIAAAIAAIAASRAASIAKKQSSDSAISIRWQMYKMHWESFNELLSAIEVDLGVLFFKRAHLYDVMFPGNRNPKEKFSETGSDDIAFWQKCCMKLIDSVCSSEQPSYRELSAWVHDYFALRCCLSYSYSDSHGPQLWLGGVVPSGVNLLNYERAVPIMSQVLERLCAFAFVSGSPSSRGVSRVFKEGFNEFIMEVIDNKTLQNEFR